MAETFDDESYSHLRERALRWQKRTEDYIAAAIRLCTERAEIEREGAELEQIFFDIDPDRERAEESRREWLERRDSMEIRQLSPAQREDAKHVLNRFLVKPETR